MLSGRRIDQDRFETLLVHGSLGAGEESMADLVEREGAEVEVVPSLGPALRPDRDAAALARIAAIARRFRPHVVHTHTAKAGFIGRLAALGALRPRPVLVHTFHGHVLEGYFGPLRNRLYRTLERRIGRRTDCLVGVSQSTVNDLVRLGIAPPERFRVIPLGLDLEPFATPDEDAGRELRRELGVGEEEVVATFIGRLVEIKRADVLLRGFALADAGRSLRLLVVGDGELRSELEALARGLGIAERVNFLGYRRDLPSIAAATDIAVLSSANEGTPVSLIEAAAAGVPAVASRVGGVPDVVTPAGGILFESGDADALGGALSRLAGDRALRVRLGAGAREHVLRRYSIQRLVGDVEALYEELLRRASHHARNAAGARRRTQNGRRA
jgi:glycosyltransferase involved in cell wall biosynthesis